MNCDLWRVMAESCSLDLSLLFIVLLGRNFLSGIGTGQLRNNRETGRWFGFQPYYFHITVMA